VKNVTRVIIFLNVTRVRVTKNCNSSRVIDSSDTLTVRYTLYCSACFASWGKSALGLFYLK